MGWGGGDVERQSLRLRDGKGGGGEQRDRERQRLIIIVFEMSPLAVDLPPDTAPSAVSSAV